MKNIKPSSVSQLSSIIARALSIALLATVVTNSTNAQVIFDDAVNGNASSDGSAPTPLTFGLGSNIVNGTVTSPANVRNFYAFTIGAGQELSAINLDSASVTTANGGPSNDPGFFALVSGLTADDPVDGFSNLGGELYDPSTAGTNLLDLIGGGGISDGSGFSNIGPGDFTFVIQQTGDEISSFSLDFQVTNSVPEPTSGVVLLGLGLAGVARRRRR